MDTDIMVALRTATAAEHARLDAALDLLADDGRHRIVKLLARLHGFHQVWEPLIVRLPECRSVFAGRGKLAFLRDDLLSLGFTEGAVSALPRCEAAAHLVRDWRVAFGSMYVMEGSTLGGQVIARRLALPLRSLVPYGSRTGAMWRAFGAAARASLGPAERGLALEEARETFAVLQAWLTGDAA